jgi:hypothetical protein
VTPAATGRLTSETESEGHTFAPPTRDAKLLAHLEQRFAQHGAAFNSRERARTTGRAHVVGLGDSHLFVLRDDLPHENVTRLVPHAWFDPCIVTGATARGLLNPFSYTNALNIYRRRIELAEPWQPVVFQLGEVDCGFLIWFRAREHGEPIDDQLRHSVESYVMFISEVRARGFEELYVLSAPLPTMRDDHEWKGTARARTAIRDVPQRDRTELTRRYNAELARRAGDYTFLEVTEPTLDERTGVISAAFVNPDQDDHHLAVGPYSRLVAEQLGPRLRPPS